MKHTFRSSVFPAIVGGLVVAVVFVGLNALGVLPVAPRTTVVEQTPLAQPSNRGSSEGLTPREVYKRDAPGVVNVRAQIVRDVESPFDLAPGGGRGQSSGSGFVVDRAGYILTNAHVIEGASKVTVQFGDQKTVDAEVKGKDSSTDIALLKVDPKGLELNPLELAKSGGIQVGDPVIAIGNPFGLDRTLTTGVVSALQRRIEAPNGFSIDNVIQTDAAINPGNSGGPLLDGAGKVIGINSQIATGAGGQGNIGIGFAVPADTARKVIPQLKEAGRVQRAYIGITGLTIDKSLDGLDLAVRSGVLVQTVQPGSPADKAGIEGGDAEASVDGSQLRLGGDVITEVGGRKVVSMDQVASMVSEREPGETLKITFTRDGDSRTVTVKLAQRPERAPQR